MFYHMRELREKHELTQRQIADMLQVHQTTYSDYELGKVNIPVEILIQLAEYYQTSIDYLVDHTDNPKPYSRR